MKYLLSANSIYIILLLGTTIITNIVLKTNQTQTSLSKSKLSTNLKEKLSNMFTSSTKQSDSTTYNISICQREKSLNTAITNKYLNIAMDLITMDEKYRACKLNEDNYIREVENYKNDVKLSLIHLSNVIIKFEERLRNLENQSKNHLNLSDLEPLKNDINSLKSNSYLNSNSSNIDFEKRIKHLTINQNLLGSGDLNNSIHVIINIDDNRYAVGYKTGLIQIRDKTTHIVQNEFEGHSNSVSDIVYIKNASKYYTNVSINNLLISVGFDGLLKIWDLDNNKLHIILGEHEDKIRSLILLKQSANNDEKDKIKKTDLIVASAGENKEIKIWNISNSNNITKLIGHKKEVYGLLNINNSLLSISKDKTIRQWSTKTSKVEKIINLDYYASSIIQLNKNHFAIGLSNGDIQIWDIKNVAKLSSIEGHNKEIIYMTKFNDDYLISTSDDKSLRIWNWKQGRVVKEVKLKEFKFNTCLHVLDYQIIVGGDQGILYIFEY